MYQLAQLNIAKAVADLNSDAMSEFTNNLARVNALAEQSKGFIWRLQDESGDATNIKLFDDRLIIPNMSVWHSIEDLKAFVFESTHLAFLKRKREWFVKMPGGHQVMWWVKAGHKPDLLEAKDRLSFLQENKETAHAFTFKHTFDPPN